MKNSTYPILVVDDEESIRRLLQKELASPTREIFTADSAAQTLDMVRQHWFDVIIMDLLLPDSSDLNLLIKVRDACPYTEVVMITGHGDIDSAVEAMKLGACDFIPKPFNLDRLDLIVEKAHQRARLSMENKRLKHRAGFDQGPAKFIGNSKAVHNIHYLVDKVADANIPILITGESGVIKVVFIRNDSLCRWAETF